MRSPEITESYGLATVEEGQKVDLSCKAIGNPSPKIKWKRRDGRKMNFLSRSGEIRKRKCIIFSRFCSVYLGIRFCPHHLAKNALKCHYGFHSVSLKTSIAIYIAPVAFGRARVGAQLLANEAARKRCNAFRAKLNATFVSKFE